MSEKTEEERRMENISLFKNLEIIASQCEQMRPALHSKGLDHKSDVIMVLVKDLKIRLS